MFSLCEPSHIAGRVTRISSRLRWRQLSLREPGRKEFLFNTHDTKPSRRDIRRIRTPPTIVALGSRGDCNAQGPRRSRRDRDPRSGCRFGCRAQDHQQRLRGLHGRWLRHPWHHPPSTRSAGTRLPGPLAVDLCVRFQVSWECFMESILSTLAFALLIGGQFLAVIVLNSNREAIYSEPEAAKRAQHPSSEQIPSAAREQSGSVAVSSFQYTSRPSTGVSESSIRTWCPRAFKPRSSAFSCVLECTLSD